MGTLWVQILARFNTQPPEGGCASDAKSFLEHEKFQHTAARRRLLDDPERIVSTLRFQHTAARRRLPGIAAPP